MKSYIHHLRNQKCDNSREIARLGIQQDKAMKQMRDGEINEELEEINRRINELLDRNTHFITLITLVEALECIGRIVK